MTDISKDNNEDGITSYKQSNGLNETTGTTHGKMAGDIEVLHPSLVLRTKERPDPEALGLKEEIPGWHGYVEWEKYPERKKDVQKYMKKFDFPKVGLYHVLGLFCCTGWALRRVRCELKSDMR